MKKVLNRRRLLGLASVGALQAAMPAWAQGGAGIGGTGIESGIGGTGIDAGLGGTGIEAGIGGTGIYGLIEGFSSIWVNDVKIDIPSSALITLNGRQADETALSLGQTVAVEAAVQADGTVLASRIEASYALVGPISSSRNHREGIELVILNQRVQVSEFTELPSGLQLGDWVVVTGLRDHRSVIQAANLAITSSREAVITGPVAPDGTVAGVPVVLTSGALSVGGLATVQGPLTQDGRQTLVATSIVERPSTIFDPRRVSNTVLGGLPGGADGQLVVDGVAFALPGLSGQVDPSAAGVRGRVHGRFALGDGGFKAVTGPFASSRPRAPFKGDRRDGPGKDAPHKASFRPGTSQGSKPQPGGPRPQSGKPGGAKPPRR